MTFRIFILLTVFSVWLRIDLLFASTEFSDMSIIALDRGTHLLRPMEAIPFIRGKNRHYFFIYIHPFHICERRERCDLLKFS